jgi:hypothetical protein
LKKKSIFADARTLEDAFFTKENARLLEQLKGKQKREALREMVKVEDETFLDRLIELGIGPETVLALTLVPLIAVAWADGTLDGRERDAIIKAAEEKGVSPETAGHQLLETWLTSEVFGKPSPTRSVSECGKGRSIGPWPWLRHPVVSWG